MNVMVSEYLIKRTITTRKNKTEKVQCGKEIPNSVQRDQVDFKLNNSFFFYVGTVMKIVFSFWEHSIG